MMRHKFIPISLCFFLTLCGVLGVGSISVQADTIQEQDLEIVRELISVEKVKQIARKQFADQVEILEVEGEVENGQEIFEVELIDQAGVKHELKIDAKSGKVLKLEKED